jgi:hypothetical protein
MDQRISFVTLAVADLEATRRFHLDGLGWQAALDVPDQVLMIRAGAHLVLSLWAERQFEAEVGQIRCARPSTASGVATRVTSGTPMATCGKSPTTPDR